MNIARRNLMTVLGLGGLGTFLASCNTLHMFSVLTPKESGVKPVARGVAYGANPRQSYDVYAPSGTKPDASLPVIVFFYGGGWNSGSKDDYVWVGYALAALGYVVVIPDYRVVPEVLYPDFLDDCAAAVKHIIGHVKAYGGDPSRLGLSGHSAGGYNAVMLALDPRYLGADAQGRSPVTACAGISGPYDFYPFDVPESKNAFGQWPKPEETQPVTYARKTNTHFLLLQSRADKIVGVRNAVNLDARLRAAGSDVQLTFFDGLSHQDMLAVVSIPFRNKAPVLADLAAFFKAKL